MKSKFHIGFLALLNKGGAFFTPRSYLLEGKKAFFGLMNLNPHDEKRITTPESLKCSAASENDEYSPCNLMKFLDSFS